MSPPVSESFRKTGLPGGLADSPWPKFRCDARNSGCSPGTGARDGRVVWRAKLGSRIVSPPSIGPDGTAYVIVEVDFDGRPAPQLVAVDRGGVERWRLGANRSHPDEPAAPGVDFWAPGWDSAHSPAVARDGTVYVGAVPRTIASTVASANSHLLAVDPRAGRVRGHMKLSAPISSPTIAADGTVYAGVYRGGVSAVTPAGHLLWASTGRASKACACPALGPDGIIYHGSRDTFSVTWDSEGYDFDLSALGPDGDVLWNYGEMTGQETPGMFPALGRGGAVYAVLAEHLFAFSGRGETRWRRKGLALAGYPAVARDGTIRVAGRALFAISPRSGADDWAIEPCGQTTLSDPAIDAAGITYVGARAGQLAAVAPSGELEWCRRLSRTPRGARIGPPVVGGDGIVYAGTSDGYLCALA